LVPTETRERQMLRSRAIIQSRVIETLRLISEALSPVEWRWSRNTATMLLPECKQTWRYVHSFRHYIYRHWTDGNDLYCVEWEVKLYYTIPYHTTGRIDRRRRDIVNKNIALRMLFMQTRAIHVVTITQVQLRT